MQHHSSLRIARGSRILERRTLPKSAVGISRRARPRKCWAAGTLFPIAHLTPRLHERHVHTLGGQVKSQPAGLRMQLDYNALIVPEPSD